MGGTWGRGTGAAAAVFLVALASLPAGYAVVHLGPARLRTDAAGAVVTVGLAAAACLAGAAGWAATRRRASLSGVVLGLVVLAFAAWAIAFRR
jgi:hypothetical protein